MKTFLSLRKFFSFVLFGVLASLLAFAQPSIAVVQAEIELPAGTLIPVALHGSLSTKKSAPGQVIKARIMQDIPVGEKSRIRAGSYVQGKIISVTPAANGKGASITFQFDQLVTRQGTGNIKTNMRALASIVEVNSAQIPQYDDRGSSSYANTTWQIGGETVYRGGGHVMDGHQAVGQPVEETGVLGHPRPNLSRGCRGEIEGNNRLQAFWLFSSDACGVYGYRHVRIAHAGRTDPVGEITLSATQGDVNIRGGSGILLRVDSPSEREGT